MSNDHTKILHRSDMASEATAKESGLPQPVLKQLQTLFAVCCAEGVGIAVVARKGDAVATIGKACKHCDADTQEFIPGLLAAINRGVFDEDGPTAVNINGGPN